MKGSAARIRPWKVGDSEAVITLAVRALGWAGDERDRAFFGWKHERSPFGRSPAWVAEQSDQVVGFRAFMPWELHDGRQTIRVVRAVDTATDPSFQRRGIFRQLTLIAVEALTDEGVDAVFNTPNEQSRPGYLRMGWAQIGKPSLGVQPRGLVAAAGMVGSRQPAEKWSEPVSVGEPATEALAGDDIDGILASLPSTDGWSTPRTPEYLRWRYGFEPLNYRAIAVRGGVVIFRVRRRGPSREVAVCEWLAPGPDPRAVRSLVKAAGDYGVAIGQGLRSGFLPLPRQGPVVTWRPLARAEIPTLREIDFVLGDLELF